MEYRLPRRHAQFVHVDAERAFTERNKSLLTNALKPRRWRPTVKTAVCGAISSLSPWRTWEVGWSGVQMKRPHCFQQPYSCDPCSVLCSVAFVSHILRSLLLDLECGSLWWNLS